MHSSILPRSSSLVRVEIHSQPHIHSIVSLTDWTPDASTSINAAPNSHIAPFDLSTPGTLPLFQSATLLPALRAALALNCTIQTTSHFDRKHYFYQDQPAGYQITQYYAPFARDGIVTLTSNDYAENEKSDDLALAIGIKQVQLEQDTAKSSEYDAETTLLDFNRVGTPLIEIISLPVIHSPEAAAAYVRKVQALLFSVDAVTTGMEMGGLRADVNVSIRRRNADTTTQEEHAGHSYSGITGLGQRTEIKNLSTFAGVSDAIKAEYNRQIDVLESGGTIEGETRGWSLARPNETRRLRGKEGEVDYRYMPDPDIAPLRIEGALVEYLQRSLPSVPDDLLDMLVDKDGEYGLSVTDAKILLLLDGGERLDYYQEVVALLRKMQGRGGSSDKDLGKMAGNWVLHDLSTLLSTTETAWSENPVTAPRLASLIHELLAAHIIGKTAKEILRMLFEGDTRDVQTIIEQDNLAFRPLDEAEYEVLAREVMEEHADTVKAIVEKKQAGKIMFLVGQVMRKGEEGRVEAKKAEAMIRRLVLDNS